MTDSKQIVRNLQLAPATLQSRAVTCIWEKPQAKANLAGYHVYCNDEFVALRKPAQTHLTLTELTPVTFYRIRVVTLDAQKQAVRPVYNKQFLTVRKGEQSSFPVVLKF